MSREIRLPYQNYEGKYGMRNIQPISIEYKETEWHGECWHLLARDLDKSARREFDVEKLLRATVKFAFESIGECAHESKVDGVMNKIKEDGDFKCRTI